MSNKITINVKSLRLLSVISIITTLLLSMTFQYLHFEYLTMDYNYLILISPFLLIVVHEGLHYIGYLMQGIECSKLELVRLKGNIPFVITSKEISKNKYIIVLLFPTIVLSITIFYFLTISSNILLPIILSGTISMGSGDLLLVKELLSADKCILAIPSKDELGFIVIDRIK